jgi:hypothetical protein
MINGSSNVSSRRLSETSPWTTGTRVERRAFSVAFAEAVTSVPLVEGEENKQWRKIW